MCTKSHQMKVYNSRIARGLAVLTRSHTTDLHQGRIRQARKTFAEKVAAENNPDYEQILEMVFSKYCRGNDKLLEKMIEASKLYSLGSYLGDLTYRANDIISY